MVVVDLPLGTGFDRLISRDLPVYSPEFTPTDPKIGLLPKGTILMQGKQWDGMDKKFTCKPPYRIISNYTFFCQDRALLKVGWCPESEMGPFNAPSKHSSRSVGFRCLQQCG